MINNYDNELFSRKGNIDKKNIDCENYSHAISSNIDLNFRRIRISSEINKEISSNITDFIRDINIHDQRIIKNDQLSKEVINNKLKLKTIDTDTRAKLKMDLLEITDYNIEPIKIYLSTPGGSVKHGFEIIDAIRLSNTPVHILATGSIYSMGISILLSGHKRIGSKYCRYMIHDISSMMTGKIAQIECNLEESKIYRELIHDLYKERSNIDMEFLNNIYKNKEDYFFYSKEALKLGIIDEII